jgi:hypothetical protein
MGIRLLLQPWWVRTAYVTLWMIVGAFGMVALEGYQHGNASPISVSVPGIVVIVVGCVCVAGLIAAVLGQQRARYLQALQSTSTPAERSQAIAAVRRGPVPGNPRVRDAAVQLVRLQLLAYNKNRKTSRIIYPLVVLLQLPAVFFAWSEHDYRRALTSAAFVAFFVALLAWLVLARRRLAARHALLAPGYELVPENSRRPINKRLRIVGIAIAAALMIGFLVVPVKIRCGSPGAACATAPDAQGYVHYSYVVEPLGLSMIHDMTGLNVSFKYASGEDLEK